MKPKPFIALVGGNEINPPEKYILFYNNTGFLFKPYEEDMDFIVEEEKIYLQAKVINVKKKEEIILQRIVTVKEMLEFIKSLGIEDTSRKTEWAVSNNDIKNISNIIMKGVKNLYESTW